MANPCGMRTFWLDSFWNISPSEAFLPPTSGTSSMPISSKKRTYPDVPMTCPLVALWAAPQLPTFHRGTWGDRVEGHSNSAERLTPIVSMFVVVSGCHECNDGMRAIFL